VKRKAKIATSKNGVDDSAKVSPLGRDLRKIAEKIAASGAKPLSRRDVEREVSERRGGR